MGCIPSCRSCVAHLRATEAQQLDLIENTLTETRGMHGIPHDGVQARAAHLRWWLARLGVRAARFQRGSS